MAEISMGQLKVLEKLIGDEEFRASFLEDAEAAIAKEGIELTEAEMAGIKGFDLNLLNSAIADLDARLSKSTATAVGNLFGTVVGQFFSS
jgi:hypothetical protein